MKEFKCYRCRKFLGEISKGKIHKNAVILCDSCIKFFEQCDRLMQLNSNKGNTGKEVPDFLNDLLKGSGIKM